MNLYAKLLQRKENPLRLGLIGAGKFAAMYLAQVPKTPGVRLVAIADLSPDNARENLKRVGWDPAKFPDISDDWQALVANPDLVAIYASNDDLALGAAQAVKTAGLTGKVAVIGLNGTPPALAAVHKGEMAATVLLDPVGWGKMAAETVADFLQKGKEPEPFVASHFRMVGKADAYDLVPPPLRERLGVTR